jgi:cell division protein FtsI/penicillin-binding protein 2
VTDTYEPGSTFKLVTVTGALSEGLVKPTTTFTLPVCIQVANYCIHDAEQRNVVTYSVAQILQYSSNVGAITLAEKLGAPALMRWIEPLRLRARDGHRLPRGEHRARPAARELVGLDDRQRPDRAGIAVTPIQMASVYAAVANDGVWVQPHHRDAHGRARAVQAGATAASWSVDVDGRSSRC